jgi:hypothetical protein
MRYAGGVSTALRDELGARFRRTVERCARPDGWPPLELPAPLCETILGAARLGACPPSLLAYYAERMPALLVEQLERGDPARELLWRPLALAALPRLGAALDGMYRALAAAGIDAEAFCGAASPAALLAARPSVAALYAFTLFGRGLPLVGAFPAERALYGRDLERHDPDAVIDLRLSAHLVHELCHGPTRALDGPPAPWMIVEAAALHLGSIARAAHIFPDEAGEAVPGVALFTLVGQALARRFGRAALWRVLVGEPLDALFGRRVGRALAVAGWQDWLARREPPFARDALAALAWIKLADGARARSPLADACERAAGRDPLDGATALPDLLAAAARTSWRALPWWSEEPENDDLGLVDGAVRALFQVQRMAPTFQTHPSEPPGGRLWLDVERCTLAAEPRPDGIFGEPAWWLWPPPLARKLAERGVGRVRIEGAARRHAGAIAAALVELCLGAGALAEETVLAWTCSR